MLSIKTKRPRQFLLIQFGWMGLLRETGKRLTCKGRIFGKNLDNVRFWSPWQRPHDSTSMIVSSSSYTDRKRWCFFLIISQLHIKNLYRGIVVKIIQQWCIFTVILIPKDTLNPVFSCIKLSHQTYSEFERLSNVAPLHQSQQMPSFYQRHTDEFRVAEFSAIRNIY